MAGVEWHGEEAQSYVRKRAASVLAKCAMLIKGEAQELLGVAGTGTAARAYTRQTGEALFKADGTVKTKRMADGDEAVQYRVIRKKAGRRVYGKNPSAPGEPPRKQTGQLRRSVQAEVDRDALTARVGTNVEYGKHLELGTRKGLAARPWLRPAYLKALPKVRAWLATLKG